MKVIIDIPKTEFNRIKKVWSKRRGSVPYTNIAFGTPIPDNATNGDMFVTMFPNCEVSIHRFMGFKCGIDVKIYVCEDECFSLWLPISWWNAPYKKEVE